MSPRLGACRASNTQPVLVTRFEADSAEPSPPSAKRWKPLKKWIEEAE
ncbi:MAG: hypothetical protein ACLSHC_00995 [Bilophila wadsworthia]